MTDTKILVVEDEVIVARNIEKRLISAGYKVAGIASSGEEAIELAGSLKPDLVLMDIGFQLYVFCLRIVSCFQVIGKIF